MTPSKRCVTASGRFSDTVGAGSNMGLHSSRTRRSHGSRRRERRRPRARPESGPRLVRRSVEPTGGDDWTIGAELAHLAFWDRVHVGRLRAAVDQGNAVPPPLPDGLTDIINNGELGTWRRLPGRDAIDIFESASRDVDEYVATLDPVIVEGVRAAGMARLVERFRHRLEHADEIERSL
jgi:hypothetical protein